MIRPDRSGQAATRCGQRWLSGRRENGVYVATGCAGDELKNAMGGLGSAHQPRSRAAPIIGVARPAP